MQQLEISDADLQRLADAIADRILGRLGEPSSTQRFFDRQSLAEELGISVSSVDRMVTSGRVHPMRVGRRVVFDLRAVQESLAGNSL